MTHEVYRGNFSDIAKIYTADGFSKVNQKNKKRDSQMNLYVEKKVARDAIQARIGKHQDKNTYVIVSNDDRLEIEYLAFLLNSLPWKVMLGDGNKFLEGYIIQTSISALKKLPVVLLSSEEQSACVFLNSMITTTYDALGNNEEVIDDILKKAYHYLVGIRDYISLEIYLDGALGRADISVLSAWMEKKRIFDDTHDKNEALRSLIKAIFSSNDELRDRINKMKLFIDENADTIFNQFPQ